MELYTSRPETENAFFFLFRELAPEIALRKLFTKLP